MNILGGVDKTRAKGRHLIEMAAEHAAMLTPFQATANKIAQNQLYALELGNYQVFIISPIPVAFRCAQLRCGWILPAWNKAMTDEI